MKVTLQMMLHILCVLAGFGWVVREVPQLREVSKPPAVLAKQRISPKNDRTLTPAVFKVGIEQRLAGLTPENWANELSSIAELGLAELSSALRGALTARYPSVRRRLISELFKRWIILDRASALTALRTMTSPQMKATALNAILAHWVTVDEQKAWQWVAGLDDDSVLQESGVDALLSLCVKKNPHNYVNWAEQLEDPFLRYKALHQIAQTWAREDTQGALAAALATSNDVLRWELLKMVCYRDDSGVARAEAMSAILQLPDRTQRAKAIADHWMGAFAQDKPDEAFQWFLAHAANPDLQKAGHDLGGILAAKARSVAEIQNQILQIPQGPARDAFTAQAAATWATGTNRVQEARALLALCGPCIERQHALEQIESISRTP